MPRIRSRALRLNRSTSFSSTYVPVSTSNMTFGQHFAQTALRSSSPALNFRTSASNLRASSPVYRSRPSSPSFTSSFKPSSPVSKFRPVSPSSSSNNSTNSSSYSRMSKDYGYSSGQSASYQNSSPQSYSSYLDVKPSRNLGQIQRHASFNPADYRHKYSNSTDIAQYKDYGDSNPKDTPPSIKNHVVNTTPYKSYSELQQLTPTQFQSSERRSLYTKCRRSTSLLNRYKPKALRFTDRSPCILSIYVAEPKQQITEGEDRKVHGILKTPEQKDVYDEEEETEVESCNDEDLESLSDESFKAPPVIPRSVPPARSDSYQNGLSTMKDATFGSTADSHYKQLYEKTVEENERLRKQLEEAKSQARKKEQPESLLSNGANASFITVRKNFNTNSNSSGGSHSLSPTATPSTGNSTHLDESDRRAYERKIAELEYELQKARQLQSDHKRLKDENNALIRVISKLSKDYPRQTTNSSISTPTNASSTGAQTKSGVQTTKVLAKENTKQLSFQNN